MRPLIGTSHSATSSAATLLYTTDTNTRMYSISFKARAGNSGNLYVGGDTSVLVASGYELRPGDSWSFNAALVTDNNIPGTIKANLWHMSAPDTGDKLDWAMILET